AITFNLPISWTNVGKLHLEIEPIVNEGDAFQPHIYCIDPGKSYTADWTCRNYESLSNPRFIQFNIEYTDPNKLSSKQDLARCGEYLFGEFFAGFPQWVGVNSPQLPPPLGPQVKINGTVTDTFIAKQDYYFNHESHD